SYVTRLRTPIIDSFCPTSPAITATSPLSLHDALPISIRRAQARDLRAFESLVRAYQGDAWRFAYHLTRNRAAADDVTQEAFVRAFRAIASYRGEWKFTAWLLRIVRNCAIDVHRRARREERL